MRMINIRAATDRDGPAVQRIRDEANAFLRSIYQHRAEVARPADGHDATEIVAEIVAENRREVVGVMKYRNLRGRLHLFAMGVRAGLRGTGIGKAMLRHVEQVPGCRKLSLSTVLETGNPAIFEKMGFAVVRAEPDPSIASPVHPVLHDVYMEKVL